MTSEELDRAIIERNTRETLAEVEKFTTWACSEYAHFDPVNAVGRGLTSLQWARERIEAQDEEIAALRMRVRHLTGRGS